MPVAQLCDGRGVSGTLGHWDTATLPSRDGHTSALCSQSPQILLGAPDRTGQDMCGAGMDPAVPWGWHMWPQGQTQLSLWGWHICQDRPRSLWGWHVWPQGQTCPNLQPWAPSNSRARKGRFMTPLTLQVAESDGEGFLLHFQALKNPVGSQSLEAPLPEPHSSMRIIPRLQREGAAGAEGAEGRFSTSFSLGRV